MNTEEAIQGIESDSFSAAVNLASDLKTFLRILAAQEQVKVLSIAMERPEALTAVSGRFVTLAGERAENELEHRWDTAMAAYLWMLRLNDLGWAKMLAASAAERKELWWARKVAQTILRDDGFHSSSRNMSFVAAGTPRLTARATGKTAMQSFVPPVASLPPVYFWPFIDDRGPAGGGVMGLCQRCVRFQNDFAGYAIVAPKEAVG